MTLMLILVAMTAAAAFAVIWPLVRNARDTRSGSDIAVYRDQLDEVERDRAAARIGDTEAAAARVEISRRLLAAADAAQATPPALNATTATTVAWRRRIAASAALLGLPALAGGFYLWLGSPELASAQQQSPPGIAAAQDSIDNLVAQAEAHLQRNPEDGRGWEILAPVYMRLDRYSDSVAAWRNALRLLGDDADREANLGEALTAEANGVVTAEAKAAFVRAVTLDNTTVSARYYLGLAAEQDGRREEAGKIWRDLIAEAPAGAPWLDTVRSALARVDGNSVASSAAPFTPRPDVANQPSGPQSAMIQGMVDSLAARLKQDGSDVDGWVRLVRSYKVLGEADKARAATADARQALAGDPDKLSKLDAALKALDTEGTTSAAPEPSAAGTATSNGPAVHQGGTIQDMVERLAQRLKESGSDPEGWLMLVRSYASLGERDKATAAVADARRALAADPAELEQFNAALAKMNIGG
jgi:cytochrome c-type biogenesis protein CcmH